MNVNIPSGNLEDWINELKLYQKNSIQKLLLNNTPEKVAEIYITSTGPQHTIPFGGERDTKPFWDRFREEFRKFICDDNAYFEEKLRLSKESTVTRTMYISAISAALGATIGFSATLLAPTVAILLSIVVKMGINAYCKVG